MAAGDAAGGMPDTLVAASHPQVDSEYHLFMIVIPGTNTTDFGFDTSITAANLIADTAVLAWASAATPKFQRIGTAFTDGSMNIIPYIQNVDDFMFIPQHLTQASGVMPTAETLVAAKVPTGLEIYAHLHFSVRQSGSSNRQWVVGPGSADYTLASPSTSENTGEIIDNTSESEAVDVSLITNTSGEIKLRCTGGTINYHMITRGWRDPRGKTASI